MDAALSDLEQTSNRLIGAVQDMATRLNTAERVQLQLQAQQNAIEEQQASTKTQRKINGWLMISIALDVLLSIGMGFGLIRINADRIDYVQTRTSDQVLCPLYAIFLASVAHPRPVLVDTPEKKASFEKAAATIRQGYVTLGCVPKLK